MLQIIFQLWRDESGSTAVEYALLLGVLGVGSLAGIVGATERIVSAFNTHETIPMIAMADQPDVTRTH